MCFTYGTWFGIEGLVAAARFGTADPTAEVRRACAFLAGKQNPNGGWGESHLSCVDKSYSETDCTAHADLGDEGSGVVQTAWALLGLMAGKYEDRAAVERGVRYLMDRQLPSGDWPQEGITGVFNRSCGITYTAYRNVFTVWALGRYAREYQ